MFARSNIAKNIMQLRRGDLGMELSPKQNEFPYADCKRIHRETTSYPVIK